MEKKETTKKTAVKKVKAVTKVVASKVKAVKEKKETVKKVVKSEKVVKQKIKIDKSRFAVIKLSGEQLKVYKGGKYEIRNIPGEKGDKLEIKEVLLVSDGKDTKIGKPYVKDAVVSAIIDSQKKGKKIDIYTYTAKSRKRKTKGYRGQITRIEISNIA